MKRIYSKRVPHWRWEYRVGHEDAMLCALREHGVKVRFVGGLAELVTDAGSLVALPGQFIVLDDARRLLSVLSFETFHENFEV
jgi:hypothetical protein